MGTGQSQACFSSYPMASCLPPLFPREYSCGLHDNMPRLRLLATGPSIWLYAHYDGNEAFPNYYKLHISEIILQFINTGMFVLMFVWILNLRLAGSRIVPVGALQHSGAPGESEQPLLGLSRYSPLWWSGIFFRLGRFVFESSCNTSWKPVLTETVPKYFNRDWPWWMCMILRLGF